MRDVWDIFDPNSFYNVFTQNLEISQEIIKEINNSAEKHKAINNLSNQLKKS